MTTKTQPLPSPLLLILFAALLAAGCQSSCGTVGELGNIRFHGQDDAQSRVGTGTYAVGARFMVRAAAENDGALPDSATAVSTNEDVWTVLAPIVRSGELTFDVEAVGPGSGAIEVRDGDEILDFITLETGAIARYVLQDIAAIRGSNRVVFWDDFSDGTYLLEGGSWPLRVVPFAAEDADLIGRAPIDVSTDVEDIVSITTDDPGIHQDLVLRGDVAGASWVTLADPAGEASFDLWVGVLEPAFVDAMEWWILEPQPEEVEPFRSGLLVGRTIADDGAIVLGGSCNFEVLTPEIVSLSSAGRECARNFQAQDTGFAEVRITSQETGVFVVAGFDVTAPQQD